MHLSPTPPSPSENASAFYREFANFREQPFQFNSRGDALKHNQREGVKHFQNKIIVSCQSSPALTLTLIVTVTFDKLYDKIEPAKCWKKNIIHVKNLKLKIQYPCEKNREVICDQLQGSIIICAMQYVPYSHVINTWLIDMDQKHWTNWIMCKTQCLDFIPDTINAPQNLSGLDDRLPRINKSLHLISGRKPEDSWT